MSRRQGYSTACAAVLLYLRVSTVQTVKLTDLHFSAPPPPPAPAAWPGCKKPPWCTETGAQADQAPERAITAVTAPSQSDGSVLGCRDTGNGQGYLMEATKASTKWMTRNVSKVVGDTSTIFTTNVFFRTGSVK